MCAAPTSRGREWANHGLHAAAADSAAAGSGWRRPQAAHGGAADSKNGGARQPPRGTLPSAGACRPTSAVEQQNARQAGRAETPRPVAAGDADAAGHATSGRRGAAAAARRCSATPPRGPAATRSIVPCAESDADGAAPTGSRCVVEQRDHAHSDEERHPTRIRKAESVVFYLG